jgi:CRP-like cAMP-binding protein
MLNGTTAEMGIVGNEGVVGVALFMGGNTRPNRATVHVAGSALRLETMVLQTEFQRGAALQRALLRYTQALLTQVSQTAVCNQLHSLEQRLCRWLLFTYDRAPTDAVYLTQEFLGQLLGVRRESITTVARHLQTVGLIRYHRGRMVLLDRAGLETMVCECYRVVKDEFTRLLG